MPRLTRRDLLGAEDAARLARALFPPDEGFRHGQLPGGDVVVEDGAGSRILVAQREAGRGWPDPAFAYHLILEPGRALLVRGRPEGSGSGRWRRARVAWTAQGLTRGVLQAFRRLGPGRYAGLLDLFERREAKARFHEAYAREVEALAAALRPDGPEPARRAARALAGRLLFLRFVEAAHPGATPLAAARQAAEAGGNAYASILHPLLRTGANADPLPPASAVQDDALARLLAFLHEERWRWHPDEREDPDEPGALDPSLLGHVFERTLDQKDAGAYYTPRALARYMARRALHGWLGSRLDPPAEPAALDERLAAMPAAAVAAFARRELLPATVLDDACGSGVFLLAALDVLLDLWERLLERPGVARDPALADAFGPPGAPEWRDRLARHVVSRNLYGLDLEPGAVEVARMRLRLAALPPENPLEPLPALDAHVRAGNALVGSTRRPAALDDAPLEEDCRDLTDTLRARGVLPAPWTKGAPLADALALRAALLRQANDAQPVEAALLRRACEAFDARVRPQLDRLHEDELARAIPNPGWREAYRRVRDELRPFHWWLDFPHLMEEGGPCVLLTNPPWEKERAETREFHLPWRPDLRDQAKHPTHALDASLAALHREHPDAASAWARHVARHEVCREIYRRHWRHQGKGDTNLYKLFLERHLGLARPGGWIAALVPGGIYSDPGCAPLRRLLWEEATWREMLGFENGWPLFEGVHRSFKAAILVLENRPGTRSVEAFFMAHAPDSPTRAPRLRLDRETLDALSPGTLQLPELADEGSLRVLRKAHRFPPLRDARAWRIGWMNEIHRSADKRLFTTRDTGVPLVEGGTFHQFDPRHRPPALHLDPDAWAAHARAKTGSDAQRENPRLAVRAIARNTDARTVIATLLPPGPGAAHSVWVERVADLPHEERLVLLGILNSLAFDYLARRRVSANLTKEILESIPLPPPSAFHACWRDLLACVRTLLESRGAYDDSRARLDALVATAYGLDAEDMRHVWQDFRALREQEPDYGEKIQAHLAESLTRDARDATPVDAA